MFEFIWGILLGTAILKSNPFLQWTRSSLDADRFLSHKYVHLACSSRSLQSFCRKTCRSSGVKSIKCYEYCTRIAQGARWKSRRSHSIISIPGDATEDPMKNECNLRETHRKSRVSKVTALIINYRPGK